MSLGRLVPWAGWDEWRQVGSSLLSAEQHEVREGIDRVAAWRLRGRVPLGVDVTASLVETQARDPALHPTLHPSSSLPDSQLRLQYGMALVRMVNGIADSAQKGKVAVSVASLASAAGLPRMLVDLRHESTHNELPSAASLRLAATQALSWLSTHYWGRQEDHLGACLAKVQELVQEYCSLHAAAAAKVASQAGADPGDEDEAGGSEGASVTAARAAAAAVAAGKKLTSPSSGGRGGNAGGGVKDGDDEGGLGVEDGGYSAASGQRRRKALLAELKMGVPRPAAQLLVGPLLQAGFSEATLTAAGGDQPTLERALSTALPHFVKEWPQLPALMLRGAVDGLAACAAGTAETPPLEWLAWVRRLLPRGEGSAILGVAAAGVGGVGGCSRQLVGPGGGLLKGWTPPPPLLKELLGMSLSTAVQSLHSTYTAQLAQEGAGAEEKSPEVDGSDGRKGAASDALLGSLRLLLDAWKGAGASGSASSAALTRCLTRLSLVLLPDQAASGAGPGMPSSMSPPVAGVQVPLRAAAPRPSAAASMGLVADEGGGGVGVASQAQQLETALLLLRKLKSRRGRAGDGGAREGQPAKRWCRAARWTPCALGNLPSASDANGRAPPMDSSPARHAESGLQQRHEDGRARAAEGLVFEVQVGLQGPSKGGGAVVASPGSRNLDQLVSAQGRADEGDGEVCTAEWPMRDGWQQEAVVQEGMGGCAVHHVEYMGGSAAASARQKGGWTVPVGSAVKVPALTLLI